MIYGAHNKSASEVWILVLVDLALVLNHHVFLVDGFQQGCGERFEVWDGLRSHRQTAAVFFRQQQFLHCKHVTSHGFKKKKKKKAGGRRQPSNTHLPDTGRPFIHCEDPMQTDCSSPINSFLSSPSLVSLSSAVSSQRFRKWNLFCESIATTDCSCLAVCSVWLYSASPVRFGSFCAVIFLLG